ncbi:MAG: hypothetical protein ACJ8AT_24490 [Hyalangium sp.]|uniref:hypothetical protein n=1 Tax=Hyalangium sp. TaxID=2028555 RepID=UPI00389A3C8E
MALRDWQNALGQLVEARASGRDLPPVLETLDGLELEEKDRAWLRRVAGTPGFELTAYVPRWWRHTRVMRSARFTLAALRESREEVLRTYLRATPCTTLFFVSEGLSFLEYVIRTTALPHVRAVAEFEQALWALRREASSAPSSPQVLSSEDVLAPHPAATLVTFDASPEALLGALLTGSPLPQEPAEPHPVLVAPGLPRMWRPATSEEARAFAACAPSATAGALTALPDVSPEVLSALLAAGALIVRQA